MPANDEQEATWIDEAWMAHMDGRLFQKLEAQLEGPEAESAVLIGAEPADESDDEEHCLAEQEAMPALGEALQDRKELSVPAMPLPEVRSASTMEAEIRAGLEKAKRCGFLAAIYGHRMARKLHSK